MTNQHTPGPYTVEKCIRVGYRGGKRHDGWNVVLNGKNVDWSRWKDQAKDLAERLNIAAAERTTSDPLRRLKAAIDADIDINSTPAPSFTFDEWRAISAAIAKATGSAA